MGADTTGSSNAGNEQGVLVQTLGGDLKPKKRLLDESLKINHKKIKLEWGNASVDGNATIELIEVPSLTTSISPEPINSPGYAVEPALSQPVGLDDTVVDGLENHPKDLKRVVLNHPELLILNKSLNRSNVIEKDQSLCDTSVSCLTTKLRGDETDIKRDKTPASPPSSLITLPDEIFQIIFSYLTIVDIIELSTTNKAMRLWLTSRIFNKIKCNWKDVDKITTFANFQSVIQQLRIKDCCRYSEWHLNLFPQLQSNLPRLNHLLINSNDSSNWLKYRHFDTITKLTLHQDENTGVGISKSIEPRIFSLDHLVNFPQLSCLHLVNYHLDWSSTIKSPLQLNKLILNNCSWGYPFKLSQFNCGCLSSLQITFSNHSFILSERFSDYLLECDSQLFSITSLSIDCKKSLSPSILTTLINNYPNLKSLTLLNWKINSTNFIPLYLSKIKWNKLEKVVISLFGYHEDEINIYAKQNYPDIEFTFHFLKPPQPFACSIFL